jgi:hypothetical protein
MKSAPDSNDIHDNIHQITKAKTIGMQQIPK